ncbi:reverse transcriptase, partial [Globisporangium polare]
QLQAAGRSEAITVSGYADDTAVYLRERSHIPKVLEILDAFGKVSGLEINKAKSIMVELGDHDPEATSETHGLTLLGPRESCRYLGVRVGQSDFTTENWDNCFRSVWSRLALAREKTHTVEQRAHLVRAVAVPKFLFVARYCWPTAATVTKIHVLIKDFVWGMRDGKRSRPWVPQEQAALPIKDGGLAVPCIRTELTTLAAMTIGKWAAAASERDLLIGDILWGGGGPRPTYITPRWGEDVRPKVRASLWETGAEAVSAAAAEHARGGDKTTVMARAERFMKTLESTYNDDGSFTVDLRKAMGGSTKAEMLEDATVLG